jgi:hypothetical protein
MKTEGIKSQEKHDCMVKVLSKATSKEEMESIAMMYILDTSYPRADICRAMKTVERQRGW